MELVDVIIFVGAVVAASISVPQYALVMRTKNTHGLALTTWVLGLGTGVGWLGHGIKMAELHMIWPNAWALFVACTVLYFLRRNGRYHSLMVLLPGIALGATLVGLDNLVGSAAFGIAVVGPQAYGMIRQGVALMRAPEVTGVSLASWVFQVINQILWLVWGAIAPDIGTFICASVSLAAAIFVLTWRILRACGMGPIGVRKGHHQGNPKQRRIEPGSVEQGSVEQGNTP